MSAKGGVAIQPEQLTQRKSKRLIEGFVSNVLLRVFHPPNFAQSLGNRVSSSSESSSHALPVGSLGYSTP